MVELRSPREADAKALVAGFDNEARRYLGSEPHPDPWACIVVAEEVVGWIDYDFGREWLQPTEVNVGLLVFPDYRGQGLASLALALLVDEHLVTTACTKATMLIERNNSASISLAQGSMFTEEAPVNDERFFTYQTT